MTVYCASCDERGIETAMERDPQFGGELCPVCEPEDIALAYFGTLEERESRYIRLYGEVQ